ncbi:MAG: nucleotide excision repair endonuclease [Candidatus Eisenbacteria bacterium]|uniref:Nucleotide excision repair endonuclease n=1 Tax=Eiseniibacteriota bacterium TaxID=2212470 RepID=A0A956NB59_UNCEI|nr:nucleotide excision repair endonuclease [Candidatus Eisenbacteria bacterium]MCB9462315.1 nucleotide excision repair endonuclease [Candidatus Eisenbacteria bacterium]
MSDLLDQFHAELLASDRAWSPDEVAARVLRMKGGPAAGLVRAVLERDGRFQELANGDWEIRTQRAVPVAEEPLRVCWFEAGEEGALRIHLAPWSPGRGLGSPVVIQGTDPSRWFGRADELFSNRWATFQPGACSRWLWRMDRHWSMGEVTRAPLDLQTWTRLVLLDDGVENDALRHECELGRLAVRWSLGAHADDGPGRLRLLAALLDHLSAADPRSSDEEIERRRLERLETRSLDWARYDFSKEDLGRLPAVPGVYRFRDADGRLLYVGKALDLSRRIPEHFRPLPQEPTKRESMLAEVRSFEYEELPSELEALVREYRAIVRGRPTWNVQSEIHAPKRFPPDWTWPLVFLAPGGDELRTVVVLAAADRGVLLDVEVGAAWEEDLPSLLDEDSGGNAELLEASLAERFRSALVLDPPEAWLALRYYVRFRDRIDRIDPLSLSSPDGAAQALEALVSDRQVDEVRDLRG